MQAHLDWLDEHKDVVLVGGSLRDNPGEPLLGALWLVDLPNRDAVEALLKTDPFWVHGLRESYELLYW